MTCHPSHQPGPKAPLIKWAPGQSPEDDAENADSRFPWRHIKLEVVTPSDPDVDALLNAGGPESGVPCTRPGCGEITRVVKELTVEEFAELSGATLVKADEDAKLDPDDTLLILACPRCKTKAHFRRKFLPRRTDG